jgi:hypothetical protein
MAPQPLSNVNPKAKAYFGPDVFTLHPELIPLAARIISMGSMIDSRWSNILIELLQADPRTGMAMYQALASAEARRAALEAAANQRLSTDDFLLFKAIIRVTTPQRRVRNEFAHHIWGHSPQVKDSILLAEPEFFTDLYVELIERIEWVGHVRLINTNKPVKPDLTKVNVWSRKALEIANKEADDANEMIRQLGLGLQNTKGSHIRGQEQKLLLDRPQVAQARQALSKQSG